MEKSEKFEEFAEALREYARKVNKTALLNGYEKRISSGDVDTVIDELKYYLENQDEIRDELQDPLDEYKELLEAENDDFDDWDEVDTKYGTDYLDDEILKRIATVGGEASNVWVSYTYDGSTLTFGLWEISNTEGFGRLVEIAENADLQFENEKELKDLVKDVADALDEGLEKIYRDSDYEGWGFLQ